MCYKSYLLELLFIRLINISTWLLRVLINSSKSVSATPFSFNLNLGSLLRIDEAGDGAEGLVGLQNNNFHSQNPNETRRYDFTGYLWARLIGSIPSRNGLNNDPIQDFRSLRLVAKGYAVLPVQVL